MMLMQPTPQNGSISRPFVAGVLMLLLFFSLSTDWSSSRQPNRRADLRQLGFPASPQSSAFPSAHEKIIYELSVTNDKLEKENWQMKQYILDLKRQMHKHGIHANASQLTFPDVEQWVAAANDTERTQFEQLRPKTEVRVETGSLEGSKEESAKPLQEKERDTHRNRKHRQREEATDANS